MGFNQFKRSFHHLIILTESLIDDRANKFILFSLQFLPSAQTTLTNEVIKPMLKNATQDEAQILFLYELEVYSSCIGVHRTHSHRQGLRYTHFIDLLP